MNSLNPLESKGNYSATSNNIKLVHWPLMGGLLHLGKGLGGPSPPRPLFAVPNVTTYLSTASVPFTYCRLKAYIVLTFGSKINLSGISPAKRSQTGPNSVYVDMSRGDNVQRILGAIGPFWAKWGLGRVPQSASFLCGNPVDLSATSQRPIFTNFGHET